MEFGRREFLQGVTIAGSVALVAGTASSALAEEAAAERVISEVFDCDIVIVGAGMSGLPAAVQAAANGDKVIALEAAQIAGGAGNGVEGCFGVDSPMQQELGIKLDKVEILNAELRKAAYAVSGPMWRDLIHASGDNIQWLIDNGVEFSGVVDAYMPGGEVTTFHWFKDGHARDGYVKQMEAAALKNGAQFIFEVQGKELVLNDGKVAGVYAVRDDGSWIQVNAKAVILAAGGFMGNEELLSEFMNISKGEVGQACLDGAALMHRMGDGVIMAKSVGAKNYPLTCIEGGTMPDGIPCADAAHSFHLYINDQVNWRTMMFPFMMGAVSMVSVDENASRFVNEGLPMESADELEIAPRKFIKDQFRIFDQKWVDANITDPLLVEAWPQMLELWPEAFTLADTIEELAEARGLDPAALRETIDTYNVYCANGYDEDYGKPAVALVPIDTPPFYIYRAAVMGDATVGAICVDRNFRALDADKAPIPGLYIAGVDSAMLYNCTYTISMPGSACANSVNSGRTSANHAHKFVQGL